jgi:hypothetical protein
MQRFGMSVVALVVALAVVPLPAAATGTSKSITFHLVEKEVGFHFIDNPPHQGSREAPLMGDAFVFVRNLMTKSGRRAGSLSVSCMVAPGGRNGGGPCYGIFSFKGGKVMGMAAFRFNGNTTEIAVVGGTGVYRGATGYITEVSRGNSPFLDATFHLVLP